MTLWKPVQDHFGEKWQTRFAEHIGVTDRAVRYWISGKRKTPKYVLVIIKGLKKSA